MVLESIFPVCTSGSRRKFVTAAALKHGEGGLTGSGLRYQRKLQDQSKRQRSI